MIKNKLIKAQNKVRVFCSPCFAFFISITLTIFSTGCSPSDNKADILVNEESNKSVDVSPKLIKKSSVKKLLDYAPTVDGTRQGFWLGGSPPINKRASRIDTYYKMVASKKPNHLLVKLQFEGVKSDDAYITFQALDGAEIAVTQPLKWLLTADAVSEVSFEVKIPETVSYLTLNTSQKGKGSSRAFILEETKHK